MYPTIVVDKYGGMTAKDDNPNIKTINKFGRAPLGIQTTTTDVWDRADAAPTQQVWLAPKAARIHTIASTDADDTTGDTGANSVEIHYLANWDTKEAIETITGNLNGGIAMTNSAVTIHRMKVIPQSTSTSINEGIITATAATDATVTAQINIGAGQTQMAIYGIPSMQDLYLKRYYASVNKGQGGVVTINVSLCIIPDPTVNLIAWITKHTIGVQSTGSSHFSHPFDPFYKISGPAIVKVGGIASSADAEASAGFDGILIDK